MRKVPSKNYVILAFVLLVTVGLVFYARDWYNTSKEYYAQNSVMTKVVREIKNDEIANFSMENQRFILYVSSGKNTLVKDFEDDFKDLIQKMDLNEEILYLNLDGVDTNDFYNSLRNKFASNSKIKNQIVSDTDASMYFFNDGKITAILNHVNEYSTKRVETVINSWEIDNA